MKEALKAITPQEKLHQIERMHSKLVGLIKKDSVFYDADYNGATLKAVLNSLKSTLVCFSETLHETKEYINYLKSIEQTITILDNPLPLSEKDHILKESFNLMNGEFIIYRRELKEKITKYCEIEYQNICAPLYHLDTKYFKGVAME
ncbi:hypothetical protein GCM10027275_00280 [Rhabdobacter roseus]|uniref:Uncharacterized protein n=1 Tax=Rhabdobacter roseus TaxID=1655419 RepID=A0A840TFI4_9BACT|nr:hypothetical protein [Rhabdobacter roseus]MBB5281911.1 hypothetical protein [Rhabdobacter roseus]